MKLNEKKRLLLLLLMLAMKKNKNKTTTRKTQTNCDKGTECKEKRQIVLIAWAVVEQSCNIQLDYSKQMTIDTSSINCIVQTLLA